MTDDVKNDRLARAEEDFPGRKPQLLTYGGREMVILEPTDGQIAAMMRLGRSGRIEDIQRVSSLLDVLEVLLADPVDRAWLSDEMLGGTMDFGEADDDDTRPPSALGLLRAIAQAYAREGDNRAERRAAPKKAVRKVANGRRST